MLEQQVDVNGLIIDLELHSASHECKPAPEFQKEVTEVFEEPASSSRSLAFELRVRNSNE